MFNFEEWKIELDIRNEYAIATTSYNELLENVVNQYPILSNFILRSIYGGGYVMLDTSKLESMYPYLVFDGQEFKDFVLLDNPEISSKNDKCWCLTWKGYYLLFDGVNFLKGTFSSAQTMISWSLDRKQILLDIENAKKSIEENTKKLKNYVQVGEWPTPQQHIDNAKEDLIKLNQFLREVKKEIPIRKREYT